MLSRSQRPLLQRVAHRIQAGGSSRPLNNNVAQFPTQGHAPSRATGVRQWSAKADASDEKKEEPEAKESLQDTIRRMQQKDGKDGAGATGDSSEQLDGFLRTARESWSTFSEEVGKTWEELLKSGDRKDINKKLINHHPEDTPEGEAPYTGPVEILVIDESEHLTAWERMQMRLTEAPIISGEWG
jgi:hypothetical protein